MALQPDVGMVPDQGTAQLSCGVVRRYVTEALFGGDERALIETVTDSELAERAWLFWAAFTDRQLDDLDVLFANADGTRVACHLTATVVQVGPWITSATPAAARLAMIECTGTYSIANNKITNFRETWR